jgi:hypothetical protein
MQRRSKLLTGVALVAWLWLLMAVVAFVPFDRDSPALAIVATTLLLWIATLVALARRAWLDWEIGAYIAATLALLVGLYAMPLRDDLPPEARALVAEFEQRHPQDRHAFARELFWDVAARFTGPSREYLLQPQRIFLLRSARYYWETEGYVPSHLLAQLYRHMLVGSDRYQSHEVVYRTGRCFNSPHGYVQIAGEDGPVYADLWAAINFDDYRFGQVVDMPSCDGITAEAEPSGEPQAG